MKSILMVFALALALAQGDCGDSPTRPTPIATPTPTPEPKRETLYLPTGESVVEIRHHDGRIEYQEVRVGGEK